MKFALFKYLPGPLKRAHVHRHGTYLALRWQSVNEWLLLYALPGGFLVELAYRPGTRRFRYRGAFTAGQWNRLWPYAATVQLPAWVPGAN